MNGPIFRVCAAPLCALMLLFSFFLLLRGHDAPGGGFIGGLAAAGAFALLGAAFGPEAVRRALYVSPMTVAAAGLTGACLAGLISAVAAVPFMTGLWIEPQLFGFALPLSTVLLFDTGVYLVVLGSVTAVALAWQEGEE